MASKRQRDIEKRYRKERKRIQSFSSRLRKQLGFEPEFHLPDIPKVITEGSIRKLQKYTPRYIREHSSTPNVFTGEVIYASERGKVKKYQKELEHQQRIWGYIPEHPLSDTVVTSRSEDDWSGRLKDRQRIYGFLTRIDMMDLPGTQQRVQQWIYFIIERYGEDALARALELLEQRKIVLMVQRYYPDERNKEKEIEYFEVTIKTISELEGYSKEDALSWAEELANEVIS